MKITGETAIAAAPEQVWQALNDPDVLARCLPGCESLERVTDTEFAGRLLAKIGPMRAHFNGNIYLSDLNPPWSYTLSGEGQGGPAGFAKGVARVRMEAVDGGTRLLYEAESEVGGKLAQMGSRMVEGTARKLSESFFDALKQTVGHGDIGAARLPNPDGTADPDMFALPAWIWATGLIVVIGAILWMFTG